MSSGCFFNALPWFRFGKPKNAICRRDEGFLFKDTRKDEERGLGLWRDAR